MNLEDLHNAYRAQAESLDLDVDVISDGPLGAQVAIVGEGLGETEVRQGSPFVGGSGQLLFNSLRQYGLHRANCYTTNVVKRQISLARFGNEKHIVHKDELLKWQGLLQWELEHLPNLRVVFVLGNYALEAITGNSGITNWRGSVIPVKVGNKHSRAVQAVCSINPAYALREPKMEPIFLMDCKKVDLVNRGVFKEHVVETVINPSYKQALAYLNDLRRSRKPFAYDIEVINMETACHGFSNDAHHGMCINLRGASGHRFTTQEEADILLAIQQVCDSQHAKPIAQNASFDASWTWLHDWLDVNPWFDTLLAHHTLYPQLPHSLAFQVAQYTTHPYYKDEGKFWREGGDIDQFWRYNCLTGDALVVKADLTWTRLDEIKPDDELLAFDEESTGARYSRRLRRSKVTKIASSKQQVLTVLLSNGQELRGTREHKIIRQCLNKHGRFVGTEWAQLGQLQPGDLLPSLGAPWKLEETREAGWLAGIFEGEGSSWSDTYPRVGFSQKPGLVLDHAVAELTRRGFTYGVSHKESASYLEIQGGLAGTLRLLGQIHPDRLFNRVMKNVEWGGFSQLQKVEVTAVVETGEEVVYDITTTAGTFIANGIIVHNCKDTALTVAVFEKEQRELESQGLTKFFMDHVMRAQPHLVSATVHGLAVDLEMKKRIVEQSSEDVAKTLAEFHRLAQEAVGVSDYYPNPNSPPQMRELLFSRLRLVGRGQSTDEANREKIMAHHGTSPIAKELITVYNKFKSEDKFLGTYAESKVGRDGRFRCSYNQAGVARAPGRLSSAALLDGQGGNMQNQPPRARAMYIADPGTVFVYFDLKQAEAQVVAVRANIETWMAQFEKMRIDGKYDAHRALASEMFKVEYDMVPKADFQDANGKTNKDPDFDEDTAEYTIRYTAKRCRHGLNYRMQAYKLAEVTGLPYHTARKAFALYHSATPELQEWWKQEEKQFKATRTIYNALGRRWKVIQRLDDDVLSSIIAFYAQSSIGDKITQVWYQAEEDDEWPDAARVCIDVHDNLVALATPKVAKTALRILKKYAEAPMMLQDAWGGKIIPWSIGAETKMSVPDKDGIHRWSNMLETHV